MDISWPHVHLMINHFPALGSLFGFSLFGAGMYLGSEDVKKAALYTIVLTAVFSGIAFLTGGRGIGGDGLDREPGRPDTPPGAEAGLHRARRA